nr:BTB/POZ domain-containing protein [Mimivirus sp.]
MYEICEFKHNIIKNQLIINKLSDIIYFWYYNEDDYACINTRKYCKNTNGYYITDINLSSDGNHLVVTSNLGDIMVYCCKSREYILSMNNIDTCAIKNAYFYHNSMITIDSNGQIKIWSGETSEIINEFNSDLSDIRKMLLVPHP